MNKLLLGTIVAGLLASGMARAEGEDAAAAAPAKTKKEHKHAKHAKKCKAGAKDCKDGCNGKDGCKADKKADAPAAGAEGEAHHE